MLASRDKTLDVNGMDVNGDTALHIGAHRGNLMITLLLLQRGANVNVPNRKGGCKGGESLVVKSELGKLQVACGTCQAQELI